MAERPRASDYSRRIGERIRDKRIELGLSQSEVAEAVGWYPSKLNNIENGTTTIDVDHLEAVAMGLGLPVLELVPEPSDPPEPVGRKLQPDEKRVLRALRSGDVGALSSAVSVVVGRWARARR